MELILASGSPRRKELLALVTPEFSVATSDVDESAISAPTPVLLVQKLAHAKCHAVAVQHPSACVLGCDTVVDVDGEVLGKPHDAADARRMMRLLSGRTHRVHTGVCLAVPGRPDDVFACTSSVRFAALSEEEIEAYIATPEPYDKAGGYAVQGGAAKFVQGIEGCYHNIMGLPVSCVYTALKAAGIVKITQNQ